MPTPSPRSLEKALDLLVRMVEDDGRHPLSDHAEDLGLPFSTAHRLTRALEERGLVLRTTAGRYLAGPALLALAPHLRPAHVLARIGRPALRSLSARTGQTVHLGALEGGMVTYLVKEARPGSAADFTREGLQLEAYCSGIGKVLLAHLPPEDQARYLADGPFVSLTAQTIVDPVELAGHLGMVREQGWAIDDAEVFDTLKCLAVPVSGADGSVIAAISVSAPACAFSPDYRDRTLDHLGETATVLAALMRPRSGIRDRTGAARLSAV